MNLRPQDFWALGVNEWRWLLARDGADAMRLGELQALARLYPDEGFETPGKELHK